MAGRSSLQSYLNRATEANFVEFARPHVATHFKKLIEGTLQITANLLPFEQEIVEKIFPVPVTWQIPSRPTVQPHPILAAIRDGMRKVLYSDLASTPNVKTLFVGSTYREIANGINNPSWNFSIHGSEPKDEGRIYSYMMEKITETVKLTAMTYPDRLPEDIEFSLSNDEVISLYAEMYDAQDNVGVKLENSGRDYERLVMEDSYYNFSWEDYYKLFSRTGANSCIVLGLLPPELVCDEVPVHSLYNYREEKTALGTMSILCDSEGYAHGYTHDKERWATLLSAPAYAGEKFNLVAEIRSRAGPFCIVEINKTYNGGTIKRDLTLLSDVYMKVLNLRKAWETTWTQSKVIGEVFNSEHYFLVKKDEYDILYDYVASLDRKAVDLEVVMSTIRKRSGGAALIDKVFTRAWELENDHYMALAATVIAKVAIDQGETDVSIAKAKSRAYGQFVNPFVTLLTWLCLPLDMLISLFSVGTLASKLARPYFPVLKQSVELESRSGVPNHTLRLSLRRREPWNDGKSKSCSFCSDLPWLDKQDSSDLQEMVCSGVSERTHEFSLSDSEVERFRETLIPCDDDPEALAAVKTRCREICPKTGFKFTTKYRVLEGAFGTGKSYQVRKLVKSTDAVIAPFRELMVDYDKTTTGDKIIFKTNHRVVSLDQVEKLFVDEAFSMPYEFLALAVWRSQPSCVYIIGDVKQCKTLPSEGLPINSRLDVSKPHSLVYNFRNTTGTIAWANKTFGYNMKPAGPEFNAEGEAFEFVDSIAEGTVKLSPDRELVTDKVADMTVRSSQGKTFDAVQVLVRPSTLDLFSIPCLKLVAVTRSRSTAKIVCMSGASRSRLEETMRTVEYFPDKVVKMSGKGAKLVAGLRAIQRFVSLKHARQIQSVFPLEPGPLPEAPKGPPHSCRFRVCDGSVCLRFPLRPSKKLDIRDFSDPRRCFSLARRLDSPLRSLCSARDRTLAAACRCSRCFSRERCRLLWCRAYVAVSLIVRCQRKLRACSDESVDLYSSLGASVLTPAARSLPALTFSRLLAARLATVDRSNTSSLVTIASSSTSTSNLNDDPVEVITTVRPPLPRSKLMQQSWEAKATTYVSEVNLKVQTLSRPSPVNALAKFRSGKDSFRDIPEQDPLKYLQGSAFNRFVRIPKTRFTGKLVGNFTEVLNSRGNIRKQPVVYKMGTSHALQFDSCNQAQGLQSLATRYACPKPVFEFSEEARSLAAEIAREGFEACIDKEKLAAAWNDVEESDTFQSWLSKARSAGYAACYTGDETADRILRFHPKANQKVKALKWDYYFKCPQGISETSKGANTLFGAACRFVSKVILASLKSEFVWNNTITPQQAAARFTAAASKVPVKDGVTLDVEEMDSMQNAFTHAVNWSFDSLLGCSDEFLSLYYSLYKNYLLVSDMAVVDLEWVKPSGAPWTLKGNTFLEFLLQNYLIEGEGPQAVFMQGDDLDRRQAGLRVNKDRFARVEQFCRFRMVAHFSQTPEFCGYVFSGGILVPSVRRKLLKLVAASIRGERHFYEYAVGLRDWVATLRSDAGFYDMIAVNAEQVGTSTDNVISWFEIIESASHCSWEQWSSLATRVPVDVMFLTEDGYSNSVW